MRRTFGRRPAQLLLAVTVVLGVALQGMSPAVAVPKVGLGLADSFAVLAGTPSVSSTGLTVVTGDLGIAPALAVIGFTGPPNGTVLGTVHAGDVLAGDAKAALTAAYLDAAARPDTQPVLGAALDGLNLPPGVYSGGALQLGVGGTLTLDGGGDPDAVFIIRMASSLTTFAGSAVVLTGQAQACNVYWQVTSSATFGTNSTFVGTVMALSDIDALTGARFQGRLLARNGHVVLDTNTITKPTCVAPAPVPESVLPTTTTSSTTTSTTSTTAVPATTTTIAPVPTPTTGVAASTPVAVGSSAGPVAPRGTRGGGGRSVTTSDSSSRTTELPRTGSDVGGLAAVGAFTLLAGSELIVLSRRGRGKHAAR